MPVPVAAIIARLEDLKITPVLRDGKLFLNAKPGVISERCERVVRENKSEIIAYLTKASSVPFEEQIGAIFKGGCTITMQPKGLSLQQYVNELHNAETRVSQKEKKPAWSQDQWQASEKVQFEKVEDYQERVGTPIPVEEPYMDTDGYMVIPTFRSLEIS